MRVINTVSEMKSLMREVRGQGKTVGFVPTMGYLHEGHLTLMRRAKSERDYVVISIFVNPLQFGVGEDYEEYPRDLSRDSALAESAGVDAVFAPTVKEMYPNGHATFVEVERLTDKLCGKSRPGHFRGVTTVVTKLFNIVEPHTAYFGQKDAQQVAVLQKMAGDLNMNLDIEVVPTVREKDGLAMSSRNSYLDQQERKAALVLSASLRRAEELIRSGENRAEAITEEMKKLISCEPLAKIDYLEVCSLPDLENVSCIEGKTLIALAVYVGKTRLIDNIVVGG